MKYVFIFVTMLSLASCGKHYSGNNSSHTNTITPVTYAEEASEIVSTPGIYEMNVSTLNPETSRFSATGSIIQDENEITITVNAKRASPLRSIYQAIYEGECPTSTDDRNGDGHIDISEARVHLEKELIQLDSDINSSLTNHTVYPTASLFGRYTYKVSGNKIQIQSDIQKKYGALKVDWEKTVVLFQRSSKEKSLPVACAKLTLK